MWHFADCRNRDCSRCWKMCRTSDRLHYAWTGTERGFRQKKEYKKNLEGRGYREVFPLFPSGKDWNEDLQELMAKGRREKPADAVGKSMGNYQIILFIVAGIGMMALLGGLMFLSNQYSLNGIKSKTVGDGQYGTARFATEKEIRETYVRVAYEPEKWRRGENLPKAQGLVVGWRRTGGKIDALIDSGDIHCLMIGAAGVGKTAHFLYPNIEYACASGMSFLTTDTKGDLFRNYAGIAEKYYGYQTSILDLRNPTRSEGNNILTLINKYMDIYLEEPENLQAKAKAEKYAKITARTIICSDGSSAGNYGQNAYFYDAAEGLLTSVILLVAEYCPPPKKTYRFCV